MQATATPRSVVDFWREAGPSAWFRKDEAFDLRLRQTFLEAHLLAARQALGHWAIEPEGALALLILLDQYPRNAFRGTAHMFATDPLALHYARLVVDQELDLRVDPALRAFCYLPFEHSEDPDDQRRAVDLTRPLDAETQRFARLHADIIERFGRFPHRNALLLRTSTEEELAFLAEGGFAG